MGVYQEPAFDNCPGIEKLPFIKSWLLINMENPALSRAASLEIGKNRKTAVDQEPAFDKNGKASVVKSQLLITGAKMDGGGNPGACNVRRCFFCILSDFT